MKALLNIYKRDLAIKYFEKLKEINLYHDEIYKIIALTYKEVKNVEKAKKLKKLV
ncbi:hypothetical protein [Methanocaldococcus vulcanius]|nr:hypothetical protein [Methanocaldococcus vulcanius]